MSAESEIVEERSVTAAVILGDRSGDAFGGDERVGGQGGDGGGPRSLEGSGDRRSLVCLHLQDEVAHRRRERAHRLGMRALGRDATRDFHHVIVA
jgi:hypothetical protein